MMQTLFRFFLLSFVLVMTTSAVMAQSSNVRETHKVKKKETLYSISRQYDITVEELVSVNPAMKSSDYKLKKGDVINIPFSTNKEQTGVVQTGKKEASTNTDADVRERAIRLGVMLPLHDINGDGRRMVEYYRGILMACDSVKKLGISVDVHAWNVPEDANIATTLADPAAAQCDLIIGPLYSKQVPALSKFVELNKNLLVIPFSINAPDLYTNRNIFQVYQQVTELNEATARRCAEWFKDYHPVIVDCADTASTKGSFTAQLRRHFEMHGMEYSITSLKSSDDNFRKAFSTTKKNLVILNSSSSPMMLSTFGKLSAVSLANPNLHISVFGYTEWLMYVGHQLDNFYKYNVYIPSPFYTNLLSTATDRLMQKYRWNFHQDMMQSLPRFALTGFDHAYFFLRGLHKYGMTFDGAAGRLGYAPVQTPLKFERIGNGGLQNRAFMFIHYLPEHKIETVNY